MVLDVDLHRLEPLRFVIMEFTRPMDGDLQAVRRADEQKDVKYRHLKQVLERALSLG